jgi:hypothetical protein
MSKRKITEPEELVKINTAIRNYGGRYANWKSGGCSGGIPADLLSRLEEVFSTIEEFYKNYKGEKID